MSAAPQPDQHEYDIFLSYSRHDTKIMQAVKLRFEDAGLRVWIDQTGIRRGTANWRRAIEAAIRASLCLVVVMSPDARKSDWVNEEIDFAAALRRPIFMILTRGSDDENLMFGYSRHQWTDIRPPKDFSAEMDALIQEIKRHKPQIAQSAPPPEQPTPEPIQAAAPPSEQPAPEPQPVQASDPSPAQPVRPPTQQQAPPAKRPARQKTPPAQQRTVRITAPKPAKSPPPKPAPPPAPTLPQIRFPMLAWPKLLWWVLFTPGVFQGKEREDWPKPLQRTGSWLAANLTILPLLIMLLGLAAGWLPGDPDFDGIGPFLLLGSLLLVPLTAWLDRFESVMAYVVAGGVAGGVAFGVAGGVAGGVAYVVAFGVAGGVAVGVAGGVAGLIDDSIKQQRPNFWNYLTAVLLVGSNGFLIWYCWLGGYRVFLG
jgi:hypothetical protein